MYVFGDLFPSWDDDDFNIYNVENVEYNEDFGGDIYN